jgi:hypothetical protein
MAKVTSNTLNSAAYQGLVNEDVMQKIWDISNIPLPFTDMIGTDTSTNSYKEWTVDALQAVNTSNAVVDGADITSNNENLGTREGNHHQISAKRVQVSHRARNVDTIGRTDELSYQIIMRQRELRRDVEAIMLTYQASRADNGTLAGLSAGLNSWIITNDDRGSGATATGFSSGVVAAATQGTTRTLTETLIRQAIENVYIQGGDSAVLMGIPELIRRISQYMFTSSARIATLTSDQGTSGEKATALGSVNVFVSDFGTVELIPNRLMPITNSGSGTENTELFVLDPMYLSISFLQGYMTEPLAKTGTADNRMMTVDWTLCVKNEKAQAIIADIDYKNAVTS